MKLLPQRRSRGWLWILLAYFIVTLVLVTVPQVLISGTLLVRALLGLAALSAAVALAACAGGYFGFRLYFLLFTAGVLAGAVWMFQLALSGRDTGWADLTSLAAFLFLTLLGLIFGLTGQLVATLVRAVRKRYVKAAK